VTVQELIQQIESLRKAEKKLPTWFNTKNIYYPHKLNLEQTSSEITARYKASIVSGKSLADITGGFGVDSFYFSEIVTSVDHFELNKSLSEITNYNFSVLEKANITCYSEDGVQQVLNNKYDVIYADPSRRNNAKGKVFFLKDCEPNIPIYIDSLLKNCNQLLIKTSPMLDLSIGLEELKSVSEIHIVASNNEVKELLWLLSKKTSTSILIKTINFNKKTTEVFDFNWKQASYPSYSLPKRYLYEPNAAIMKSGAFDLVSEKFKLDKLHQHTHLYTSDELIDFPGRKFKINEVIPYKKKEIKKLKIIKANISIRNFPETVSVLRKKLKISDGGMDYLFFVTTNNNKKQILVCSKV